MSDSFRRLSFRLLASGALTLALAATFLAGFELGGGTLAPGDHASADSLRAHLLEERETLSALLAESERQRVILDRTVQIDQEAFRVLQARLAQVQDASLELNRELTYLKRLIRKDGKGAIQVYAMDITPHEQEDTFLYSFTITQLVQGFGRSTGRVRLSLEGIRKEENLTLDLEQLPAAQPDELSMDFEHFQNFQGSLQIPHDFEPTSIIVAIEPNSKLLLKTSVMFPWELSSH